MLNDPENDLHPDDQMQMISFMKNFAMAGGLLILAQTGATAFSVDAAKRPQRSTRHVHA